MLCCSSPDIQGTARVVNYAGLVRGTQRIVKLRGCGQPQDDLLKVVIHINGLRYGSDETSTSSPSR